MGSQKNETNIDIFILPKNSIVKEKTSSPKSIWHVDKEMLRFKVHFFLFTGGNAAAAPYAVVFAKDRLGISASSLGAVLTAQMFLFVFTKVLIGYLADYFNKLKVIISALTIIYTACFFVLLALPSIEIEKLQTSSELVSENVYTTKDISTQCVKYHEIFYKTISKYSNNVPRYEFSILNFNKSLLLTEFDRHTCSSFLEQDFESVLLDYFHLHEHSNEYNSNQTEEILSSTNSTSNQFEIRVLLPKITYLNATLCHLSSTSQFTDSSKNLTNRVEQCAIKSALIQKFNSDTYPNVELLCTLCDYRNQTPDSLRSIQDNIPRKKDIETYQFWVFALMHTIYGISANAIFTLSDTACCESIQKYLGDFGKQKLWGGIGWGVIAPLAGFINDSTNDFLESYILMGAMMALFLWNMSKIDLVKPHYSKNILKDVGTVLQSKDFLIFEAMVFMNGLGTGIDWYYLIWFLNSIGGSELLCGLTLTVQSLGTIPFMYVSGYIIKKVGHYNILIVSLVAYTIRFLWYSYLQNPWLVLPVEFLHGITYGLYYTALASYAKQNAKPGTEATTQAIIFSTHEGLGSGIGCVLSGIGFDYFGGHQTFFYSSMSCLSGALISLILSMHLRSRQGNIKVAPT